MSAKMAAAKRLAFLKALETTGNVTVSAERAKVSRSWVLLHRRQNPQFDAACRAALAAAKARLSAHRERRPPKGWGYLDGAELVVRGTGGSGGGRRVQIARARLRQITPRVEDHFMKAVAMTCNVSAGCSEAGISKSAIYAHRKRWPAFAKRWDAAIEEGFTRIDAGLAAAAIRLFEPLDEPPEVPIPNLTVDDAIRIVRIYERQAHLVWARVGRPLRG